MKTHISNCTHHEHPEVNCSDCFSQLLKQADELMRITTVMQQWCDDNIGYYDDTVELVKDWLEAQRTMGVNDDTPDDGLNPSSNATINVEANMMRSLIATRRPNKL